MHATRDTNICVLGHLRRGVSGSLGRTHGGRAAVAVVCFILATLGAVSTQAAINWSDELGEAGGFTLFAMEDEFSISNSQSSIFGTIALGPGAKQNFSGGAPGPFVGGDYVVDPTASSVDASRINLQGSLITRDLTQAKTDVESLSQSAFSQTANTSLSNGVISRVGTHNVAELSSLSLSGSDTILIDGQAGDSFLININGKMSLSGDSQIQLSPGLKPSDVLFNVGGDLSQSGDSFLRGFYVAADGKYDNSGAFLEGRAHADKISITSGAQVVPEPTTMVTWAVLPGCVLGGFWLRKRRGTKAS
jgi:hypothetical protein